MRAFLRRRDVIYFVFYFGLVTLLRWDWKLDLILMWLGGVAGLGFVWVDRIAHVYFTRPFEQLSIQVKSLVTQRRYKEAVKLLDHRKQEQRHLTIRSALFLMVWAVAAFFVISSTGSTFASGMVMGIGLSLVLDLLKDWGNWMEMRSWLFWQIRRSFTDKETKVVAGAFFVIFGFLSLLLI